MKNPGIVLVLLALLALLVLPACNSTVGPTNSVTDIYAHIRPSWSPTGNLIAFTSVVSGTTGIYSVDSLGSTPHLVLSGDGVGTTWSPDGKWLAFSHGGLLFKVKPNGDSLTQLSTVTGAIRPAWSRDGSKIAFVQGAPGSGVWIYDSRTGTTSQFLTFGDFPSWHPITGELVVLAASLDYNSGLVVYGLLAIDSSTAAQRVLDSFATASDCGFSSISPTGNSLVYSIKRPDDYVQIWKTDLVASTRVRLTDDGGDYAAWSPDGARIVYTRTQAGDGGLWIMNADGSNKHRLTKQ